MRFTSAIVTAIAFAAFGIQAAPTPDGASSTSVAPHKPSEKVEPKPEPKPEHPTKEPEYELVCKDVAFFHGWDIYWADLPSGSTNGTCIYECAKDLVKDKEADAIVSFDGYCYPKSLEHVQAHDFFKNKGRDLAIEGCCEDLKEDNKHKKCYPDKLFDCCYDRKICVKVPKKPKCDRCDKKDDKKDDKKY